MPLRQIIFINNGYYHVFNRGSEKRIIFNQARDYSNFLTRVVKNSQKYSIEILSYCLMPNHFHFLLHQASDLTVTSFMNALQLGYAKYFNTKYDRVGPLFQGRFKAKSIESEQYLLQVSAYIHKNPIANYLDSGNQSPVDSRNLLSLLRNYPYSSYKEYLNLTSTSISKSDFIMGYFSKIFPKLSYQSFVENFVPDYEKLSSLLFV